MAKANADAAGNAQANGAIPVSSSQASEIEVRRNSNKQHQQQVHNVSSVPNEGLKLPVEIRLDEEAEPDGEGEEEVEELEDDAHDDVEYEEYDEEGEEEEDIEVSSTFGEYGEARENYSPSSFSHTATTPEGAHEGEDEYPGDPEDDPSEDASDPSNPSLRRRRLRVDSNSDDDSCESPVQRSRKRSCDELDAEEEGGSDEPGSHSPDLRRKKEGTPPKRARKGDGFATLDCRSITPLGLGGVSAARTVIRMRKRSSEELDEDDDDEDLLRGVNSRYSNERTRRNSKKGRGGRRVSGGTRGCDGARNTSAGGSSDRERSDNKSTPHKRLKVSEGEGTRGSDGSSVSSPPTTATTGSDQDPAGR